jgi:lipopolysaccharide/colanic/teichoic acid biosynthesis glycosyltransferase
MIERMRYDLLYIENCSLLLDLKIILYTFIVIFQGRGK